MRNVRQLQWMSSRCSDKLVELGPRFRFGVRGACFWVSAIDRLWQEENIDNPRASKENCWQVVAPLPIDVLGDEAPNNSSDVCAIGDTIEPLVEHFTCVFHVPHTKLRRYPCNCQM
jgi:hypothetical protein